MIAQMNLGQLFEGFEVVIESSQTVYRKNLDRHVLFQSRVIKR